MELIMLVCGALISTLIACIFQYYSSSTRKSILLPPGRTGWPVIGESVEFIRDMQQIETEKFFLRRMTKYSRRAFRTSIVGGHYAVLCGVQGTKFLFGSNSNKFLVRSLPFTLRKIFLTGKYDEVLDKNIKPALLHFMKADGRLNNSVGVMDAIAQRQVQSWQSQAITLYPSVRSYLFALAIRLFLSIEDPKVVQKLFSLMEIATAGLSSMPIDLPGTQLNRAIKAAVELRLQIQLIVEHQRSVREPNSSSSPKDRNLLSYFIQGRDDDDALVAEAILALIFAGFETSSSALCMTFKVLADYPHVYQKVYQENMKMAAKKKLGEELSRGDILELRYTWNVVREVLRIYSPVPYITREAIVDFTFEGFHIPKGYKLMTSTYALHKDPNFFQDPQKFDPSRFDGDGPFPHTYIPFGGGPFVCPGKIYAQLSMLVLIHNVVKKFKWKCMIPDEKIVGIPHPKPDKGLPLHLYPHAN